MASKVVIDLCDSDEEMAVDPVVQQMLLADANANQAAPDPTPPPELTQTRQCQTLSRPLSLFVFTHAHKSMYAHMPDCAHAADVCWTVQNAMIAVPIHMMPTTLYSRDTSRCSNMSMFVYGARALFDKSACDLYASQQCHTCWSPGMTPLRPRQRVDRRYYD